MQQQKKIAKWQNDKTKQYNKTKEENNTTTTKLKNNITTKQLHNKQQQQNNVQHFKTIQQQKECKLNLHLEKLEQKRKEIMKRYS